MARLVYHAGNDGAAHPLDGEAAYVGVGGELRSREWERSVSARSVTGFAQAVREIDVDIVASDGAYNAMRQSFDRDIMTGSPGMLVVDGEWNMQCYVPKCKLDGAFLDGWLKATLTVDLLSRMWWREKSRHFNAGVSAGGLDFPFDHGHDLGFAAARGTVEPSSAVDSPVRITFHGPCVNPYVVIGGNRYEVDVTVPTGNAVVIDATGNEPSAILYDAFGNGTSVFPYAVRDGGLGGGSYAFEALPPGRHAVTWSGAFSWDLAWREQETEPPWSR